MAVTTTTLNVHASGDFSTTIPPSGTTTTSDPSSPQWHYGKGLVCSGVGGSCEGNWDSYTEVVRWKTIDPVGYWVFPLLWVDGRCVSEMPNNENTYIGTEPEAGTTSAEYADLGNTTIPSPLWSNIGGNSCDCCATTGTTVAPSTTTTLPPNCITATYMSPYAGIYPVGGWDSHDNKRINIRVERDSFSVGDYVNITPLYGNNSGQTFVHEVSGGLSMDIDGSVLDNGPVLGICGDHSGIVPAPFGDDELNKSINCEEIRLNPPSDQGEHWLGGGVAPQEGDQIDICTGGTTTTTTQQPGTTTTAAPVLKCWNLEVDLDEVSKTAITLTNQWQNTGEHTLASWDELNVYEFDVSESQVGKEIIFSTCDKGQEVPVSSRNSLFPPVFHPSVGTTVGKYANLNKTTYYGQPSTPGFAGCKLCGGGYHLFDVVVCVHRRAAGDGDVGVVIHSDDDGCHDSDNYGSAVVFKPAVTGMHYVTVTAFSAEGGGDGHNYPDKFPDRGQYQLAYKIDDPSVTFTNPPHDSYCVKDMDGGNYVSENWPNGAAAINGTYKVVLDGNGDPVLNNDKKYYKCENGKSVEFEEGGSQGDWYLYYGAEAADFRWQIGKDINSSPQLGITYKNEVNTDTPISSAGGWTEAGTSIGTVTQGDCDGDECLNDGSSGCTEVSTETDSNYTQLKVEDTSGFSVGDEVYVYDSESCCSGGPGDPGDPGDPGNGGSCPKCIEISNDRTGQADSFNGKYKLEPIQGTITSASNSQHDGTTFWTRWHEQESASWGSGSTWQQQTIWRDSNAAGGGVWRVTNGVAGNANWQGKLAASGADDCPMNLQFEVQGFPATGTIKLSDCGDGGGSGNVPLEQDHCWECVSEQTGGFKKHGMFVTSGQDDPNTYGKTDPQGNSLDTLENAKIKCGKHPRAKDALSPWFNHNGSANQNLSGCNGKGYGYPYLCGQPVNGVYPKSGVAHAIDLGPLSNNCQSCDPDAQTQICKDRKEGGCWSCQKTANGVIEKYTCSSGNLTDPVKALKQCFGESYLVDYPKAKANFLGNCADSAKCKNINNQGSAIPESSISASINLPNPVAHVSAHAPSKRTKNVVALSKETSAQIHAKKKSLETRTFDTLAEVSTACSAHEHNHSKRCCGGNDTALSGFRADPSLPKILDKVLEKSAKSDLYKIVGIENSQPIYGYDLEAQLNKTPYCIKVIFNNFVGGANQPVTGEPAQEWSDSELQELISKANDIYAGKNSTGNSEWDAVIGDFKVTFEFHKKNVIDMGSGAGPVQQAPNGGSFSSIFPPEEPDKYLNCYLAPLPPNYGGWAHLGGIASSSPELMEFVISSSYKHSTLGMDDEAISTFCHEGGHFFGLPHTWGNTTAAVFSSETGHSCNDGGDGINDTPNQEGPTYENQYGINCTQNPPSSCGSLDMWLNLMDYGHASCSDWSMDKTFLTMGQGDVIRSTIEESPNFAKYTSQCGGTQTTAPPPSQNACSEFSKWVDSVDGVGYCDGDSSKTNQSACESSCSNCWWIPVGGFPVGTWSNRALNVPDLPNLIELITDRGIFKINDEVCVTSEDDWGPGTDGKTTTLIHDPALGECPSWGGGTGNCEKVYITHADIDSWFANSTSTAGGSRLKVCKGACSGTATTSPPTGPTTTTTTSPPSQCSHECCGYYSTTQSLASISWTASATGGGEWVIGDPVLPKDTPLSADGQSLGLLVTSQKIRFNLADSENCGGSANGVQTGSATATIVVPDDVQTGLGIDFTGIAELHSTGYENMTFIVDGTIWGSSTSAGGSCTAPSGEAVNRIGIDACLCGENGVWDNNLGACTSGTQTNDMWASGQGCEMGKVIKSIDSQYLFSVEGGALSAGTHTLEILFDSNDELYHKDAHYDITLKIFQRYQGTDPSSFFEPVSGATPCCQVYEAAEDIWRANEDGKWYYKDIGGPDGGITIEPGHEAWPAKIMRPGVVSPNGICNDLNVDACISWLDPSTAQAVHKQTKTCGWNDGAYGMTPRTHISFLPLDENPPEGVAISVCQGACPCSCVPTETTTTAPPSTTTTAPPTSGCKCYKHKISSINGDALVFESSSNVALAEGESGHNLGQWGPTVGETSNKVPAGSRVCKVKPTGCTVVESQKGTNVGPNDPGNFSCPPYMCLVPPGCTAGQAPPGCTQPYALSAQSGESANLVLKQGAQGGAFDPPVTPKTIQLYNLNNQLVWDRNEADEHTFTSTGESIARTYDGWDYVITFDGTDGGLLFTVSANIQLTTTTPAPALIFNSQECLKIGEVHCLSYVNNSCSKKVVGDVKVTQVVVNDADTDDWITVEPLCDNSLFDTLENGVKIHLCKGPCSPASKDTFVASVGPDSCALNGDQWIKIDTEGRIINFYKKEDNAWVQQALNNPCALNVPPTTTTTIAPSSISITGLSVSYADINDIIQNAPNLEVNITGTDHHHWHWRMNNPVEGGLNASGEFMVGENETKATNWINTANLEPGTHTVHVALVNQNHELLSPSVVDSFEFIISPMAYVDGWVPDWMEPRYYEGLSIPSQATSLIQAVGRGYAWNAPIAAANQLGHLVGLGLTKPTKVDGHDHGINDELPTQSTIDNHPNSWFGSKEQGVSGTGTKVWGNEHGWGDYLIDDIDVRWPLGTCSDQTLHAVSYSSEDTGQVIWRTEAECLCGESGAWNGSTCTFGSSTGNTWTPYRPPQYQYDPNVIGGSCGLTDFGWFMNTNNSSEERAVAGVRASSGIINVHTHSTVDGSGGYGYYGTSVDNIYKGLKDFYRHAGYTNLADDATQKAVGVVYHKMNGLNYVSPKGKLPQHWDDENKSYADPAGIIDPQNTTSYEDRKLFVWETIKKEIDNNRTVIAVLEGFNSDAQDNGPSGMTHPAGFPNTLHSIEKYRTDQVEMDHDPNAQTSGLEGTDFYGIGPDQSWQGANFTKAIDGTDMTRSDWDVAGEEYWSENAIGYAVLVVGYISRNSAADPSIEPTGSGNGGTDWLIIRDGWHGSQDMGSNRQRNIIIPYDSADRNTTGANTNVITDRWVSDVLMATIYLNLKDSSTGTWIEPVRSCAPVACNESCASVSLSDSTNTGTQHQILHYDTLSQSGCGSGELTVTVGPDYFPDWISVIHHDTSNLINGIEEGYHSGKTESNGGLKKLSDALASDAVLLDDFKTGMFDTACYHAPNEFRNITAGTTQSYQYNIQSGTKRYITVIVNWNGTCTTGDGWDISVTYNGNEQCPPPAFLKTPNQSTTPKPPASNNNTYYGY